MSDVITKKQLVLAQRSAFAYGATVGRLQIGGHYDAAKLQRASNDIAAANFPLPKITRNRTVTLQDVYGSSTILTAPTVTVARGTFTVHGFATYEHDSIDSLLKGGWVHSLRDLKALQDLQANPTEEVKDSE